MNQYKTYKIHMDFRIAGSFTVPMSDEEYKKFKDEYGENDEIRNALKMKIRQFKEGIEDVDRYHLVLTDVNETDNNNQEKNDG